jgi:hypothetical protein
MSDSEINEINPNPGNVNKGEVHVGYWLCHRCKKPHHFAKGKCIKCLIETHPFNGVEKVKVKATGKVGTVLYLYYNGYTLVKFPRKPIRGGAFDNDSTYRNDELEAA